MAEVNFRVDDAIKAKAEKDIVKLGNERRFPFEISTDPDPFYSAENQLRLLQSIEAGRSGRSTLREHELIEVDE